MTYVPAPQRYDTMTLQPLRPERARRCRRSRSGSGTISAATPPFERGARHVPHRLRSRHHAFRPRQQLRPAARLGGGEFRPASCKADFAGLPRRARRSRPRPATCMWPGPYGEWGSRKYLLASLDQSLKRMGLDYVDIFYSHRVDPETPLEETMGALDTAVRQGKALYVGISSYNAARTAEAAAILREPRHALPHPPAELFDAEPLDRGGQAARHAGEGRDRLHRLLAARAGHAHRQVSEGHSGGQPRHGRQDRSARSFSARRRSRASAR